MSQRDFIAVECMAGEKNINPSLYYFIEGTKIPKFYQVHERNRDFEKKGAEFFLFGHSDFTYHKKNKSAESRKTMTVYTGLTFSSTARFFLRIYRIADKPILMLLFFLNSDILNSDNLWGGMRWKQ